MSKIAVIIPIHNGLEDTKLCLKSIYAALRFSGCDNDVAIIVVDDGSSDGSAEWIRENFPDIEILKGDGTLWWSGAVNYGVKYAIERDAKYVLLLNNDNVVDKNFFKALKKSIEQYGSESIAAAKVINIIPEFHIKYAGKSFNRKTAKLILNPMINKSIKVNTAGGMGVLIPITVFNRIGFFDENNFPQKCGDADFYLRAENSKIDMFYEPNMIVYDNNKSTGFKSNKSIKSIIDAYSYPKGYMNLKIDSKFYFKYFGPLSLFNLTIKNARFILGYLKKAISCKNNPLQ